MLFDRGFLEVQVFGCLLGSKSEFRRLDSLKMGIGWQHKEQLCFVFSVGCIFTSYAEMQTTAQEEDEKHEMDE